MARRGAARTSPPDAAALRALPWAELEAAAAPLLDPATRAYYGRGARDGRSLTRNVAAWDAWWLRPRRLTGIAAPSLATTLLGTPVAHPVLVGPSAAHRLAHPEGERATAEGVAAHGGIFVVSTSTTVPVEELARVPGLCWWFQLYPLADAAGTDAMVRRAVDAGAAAIVLTVDMTADGRTADLPASGFVTPPGIGYPMHPPAVARLPRLDWAWAEALAARAGVPVILKGILHPDDARRAADAGFPALVVSNHGGRTQDSVLPTAFAIADVAAAAGGRLEVYADSGIRRGSDGLKALALGARAVGLVRPVLWGLALAGADGVAAVLGRVLDELAEEMAYADVADVHAIPADLLVPAVPLPGTPSLPAPGGAR
ncbi:MAG: alpha-hydroxy acid oxidase [Chloroflexota bacterium]